MRAPRRNRPVLRWELSDTFPGHALAKAARDALQGRVGLLWLAGAHPRGWRVPDGPPPEWGALAADPLVRHVVDSGEALALFDLRAEARFAAGLLAGELGAVACAAVPLRVSGDARVAGLLAVLDEEPRDWNGELEALFALAGRVEAALPPLLRGTRARATPRLPRVAPAGVSLSVPARADEPAFPLTVAPETAPAPRADQAARHLALLELRAALAAAANESGSVAAALRTCLREFCAHLDWPVGRALLLDAHGEPADAPIWHAEDPARFDAFRPALNALRPGDGRGVGARALAAGKPVWLDDLRTDGTFAVSHAGWEAGLKSAVAFPVPAGGGTAAVVELYSERAEAPDPAVLDACAWAARQLCSLVERLRERAAVHDAAETLRAVLDGSPAPAVAFDAAGGVALWTAAAARLLGFTELEAATRLSDPAADGGWPGLRQAAASALAGGQPVSASLRWRRQDGRGLDLRVHCVPLQGDDGAPRGAVAHLWDVTAETETERTHEQLVMAEQVARVRVDALERRAGLLGQAGELLDASFQYLQHERSPMLSSLAYLLVPTLADFCRIDLAQQDGSVARVALVHTGARADEEDEVHAAEEDAATHPVLRVVRSGAPIVLSSLTPEVRRSLFPVPEALRGLPEEPHAFACVPLQARGRTLGALTLAMTQPGRQFDREDLFLTHDLARRTALALDNARLFRHAEAAASWREQVLAIVSHDLRNPLNVISIATGALLRGWPADSERMAERGQLALIAQQAERMRGLVADLLDLGRVESRTFSVETRPIAVGVLLKAALESHRPLAEQKGIALTVSRFSACCVEADEQRVYQVFSNLIGNALAYTPPGGCITLAAQSDGAEVRLSVADTGPGIAQADLPRVFDRFWQGKNSRGGAGLGLSISRAIVEAHGGRIWAESRPGEGARIVFTLPVAETGR